MFLIIYSAVERREVLSTAEKSASRNRQDTTHPQTAIDTAQVQLQKNVHHGS